MSLRPYQRKLVDDIRRSMLHGNKSVVGVLGCGGGKSRIAADIARSATDKGNQVLFIVHRKELCNQIYNTFCNAGVNMELCNVCMVQTVSRRIQKINKDYKLIIIDEAHHATANTYKKIFEHFPDALRIGFTATPIRLNKGGLGEVFSDLITSVSTQWLIENNYLAPYKYYSVKLADTSKLHTQAGEFKQSEVAELMENNVIYGETVKQWEKLAKGKKTIVYCSSVEAARMTCKEFENAGYKCAELNGETPQNVRKCVMEQFKSGEINILCNCDLFGEGLDIPDCECVIMLRPTQSLSLYIQQAMRSMRYMPNKTAIIIDHVGNCYRHGLPDDDREWTLAPKKKQESIIKIRECKNCFAVYPPSLSKCPFCGAEAEHEIRTVDRKTIDVDLVELKRQEDIKNTKLYEAELETWDSVREFQKLHGYKFQWCLRYCKANEIKIPEKYGKLMWRLRI